MRPPVACGFGLALLAASPSQLRSPEPRPACARDGQYGAGPKPSQIGMGFNMGGNFRFNRLAKQLPGAGAQYLSADRGK